MKEMEELIIEANIKKEDGPLRSVWEAAIEQGRQHDGHTQNMSEYKGKKLNSWDDEVNIESGEGRRSLPSPVSRSPTVGPTRLPPQARYLQPVGWRARSLSC